MLVIIGLNVNKDHERSQIDQEDSKYSYQIASGLLSLVSL